MPLRIVETEHATDTKTELNKLCEEANAGELIGIAYAVHYRGGRVSYGYVGEAYRNPVAALGSVGVLAADLVYHAHKPKG